MKLYLQNSYKYNYKTKKIFSLKNVHINNQVMSPIPNFFI